MTTNQTIDGVTLRAIERAFEQLEICQDQAFQSCECEECEQCGKMPDECTGTDCAKTCGCSTCVHCSNEQAMSELRALLDKEASGDSRAPLPQGEPVTIEAVAVTRENGEGGLRLEWLLEGGIAQMEAAGMVLFAIPEANDLCDEDGSAEVYLTPPQAEQTAPVAVVMPARMALEKPESHKAPVEIHNGVVTGWNACLDEVNRLNTK